jgi:hypothetical protein
MLRTVRTIRSEMNIGATRTLTSLVLDLEAADAETKRRVEEITPSLQAIARCKNIQMGEGTHDCQLPGVRVAIEV